MRNWVSLVVVVSGASLASAGSWPQFRGPNAQGLPDVEQKLPAQIGPEKNVVWKVALPPGHSSPAVFGERIYLTAVRDKTLVTMALDRKTGKIVWETAAPHKTLEKIHQIGSHAQPTPATDGERIISFFGSSGLLCYDTAGKLLWHVPMGPFKNEFGSGSSPILAGDKVILNQDHDSESFLLAVDKRSGKQFWKVDRGEFIVGYSTPIVWDNAGKKQVVVAGTLRVAGYDLETGKEAWTVRGLSRIVAMTPAVGPDGTLYVSGWAAGSDPGERFDVAPFAEMIAQHDKNKNGTLEADEMPAGALKERYAQIDADKDGHVTAKEYGKIRDIIDKAINRMVAIKPGGQGDVTESHVLWAQEKYLPYIPSPLFLQGHLFMIKNGGILTTVEAKNGTVVKQERVPGTASYYASPVGGDGKVYVVSQRGELTVVSALGQWQELSRARMGEDVFATPAIVDGKIYLRTAGHLYCFGE